MNDDNNKLQRLLNDVMNIDWARVQADLDAHDQEDIDQWEQELAS